MEYKIVHKRENKPIGFIRKSILYYLRSSTPKELSFDWIFPFALSLCIFVILAFSIYHNTSILNIIKKMNDASINVIAILAGFNTASLAIIFSASNNLLSKLNTNNDSVNKELKQKFSDMPKQSIFQRAKVIIFSNTKENVLKITVNFFCYAIIIQLIVLIICLMTSMTYSFVPKISHFISNYYVDKVILTSYGVFWLTLVLHSVFISIRNVEIIYGFIMYKDND
ncbi:hypothetical protein [Sporolactobacillus terrae]|uniref:hypothetical protein n=1 Tax=Sporolactobacillus terrae TaxID=269673 RepID=UPI00048E6FD4|nr:hypothetical protein [Sporolactobacillus terrae]